MAADDNASSGSAAPAHSPSLIAWPPPGLEAMQGSLWQMIRRIGLGGAILVIPLLWSMTPDRGFSDLGPFGDEWRALGVVTLVGLLIWIIGLAKLDGLLRAWVSATRNGYGWMTVAQVAADGRKDAGLLLQGAKHYANLDVETRRRIAVLRLWTAATAAAAASWTSVGFILTVLLATRGVLGPTAVEWIAIAPVVVLLLIALGCRITEAAKIWATRRSVKEQVAPPPRPQPLDDVAAWNANLQRWYRHTPPPVPTVPRHSTHAARRSDGTTYATAFPSLLSYRLTVRRRGLQRWGGGVARRIFLPLVARVWLPAEWGYHLECRDRFTKRGADGDRDEFLQRVLR